MIKKKNIKRKKKIKNPSFKRSKNKSNYNSDLNIIIDKIFEVLISGNPIYLSQLLSFISAKDITCNDCDQYFEICTCEGSREKQEHACEDCNFNYCLCDYNIKTENELINTLAEVINEIFNKNEKKYLINRLLYVYDRSNGMLKERYIKFLRLLGYEFDEFEF